MENYGAKIAGFLLQIKAIKLEPTNPFTWASGWKSPIYCDNRKTLSYPEIRQYIAAQFAEGVNDRYPGVESIAGVATGAIAHGILVAEKLNIPFVYVRSASKGHGLENQVEGDLSQGRKVVVIEDLISTGGSSLRAVEALADAGADVLGMGAIFSYEFPQAIENFAERGVDLFTLCNYTLLLEHAKNTGYIDKAQLDSLKTWREDPSNWGQNS